MEKVVARIVFVEDNPALFSALKEKLDSMAEIEIVAAARDVASTSDAILRKRPNAVVLAIPTRKGNGLDMLLRLKRQFPELAILVFASKEANLLLVEALRRSACSFLDKEAPRELISAALTATLHGGVLLSAGLTKTFFGTALDPTPYVDLPEGAPSLLPTKVILTQRETDILYGVSKGKTNRVIAEHLHLAEITVKKHLQVIMTKLCVRDRTQAALRAVRLGLIDED